MNKFKDVEIDYSRCTEECSGYSKKLRKCGSPCPAVEGYWKMRELALDSAKEQAKLQEQLDTLLSIVKQLLPIKNLRLILDYVANIEEKKHEQINCNS